MKRIYLKNLFVLLLPLILLCAASASAQGIKERMKDRLPVIVELKNQGIIGENNLGYLEFVGNKREKEDIVSAENQDRKTVYEAIAKQQNTDAVTVGKRRSLQIEEKADPGEWLQDEGGKWYQKK